MMRRFGLAHDPQKRVLGPDPGWEPAFGQDHAQTILGRTAIAFGARVGRHDDAGKRDRVGGGTRHAHAAV
jgi:hypothetical protein